MPSIAITGSIAAGKSMATSFLAKRLAVSPFIADQEITNFLENDQNVIQELITAFGRAIYSDKGEIDRVRLRAHLIKNSRSKQKLEAILHPRLRNQWLPRAQAAKGNRKIFFLAEIPLLYENDLKDFFDDVVVVGACEKVLLHRLTNYRNLTSRVAHALIKLQWPLQEKISRATYVVWNDGIIDFLEQQIMMLGLSILKS